MCALQEEKFSINLMCYSNALVIFFGVQYKSGVD